MEVWRFLGTHGVTILTAMITAGITSLVAPWVHWGIEKQREKVKRRQQLIDECKRVLNQDNFSVFVFRESPEYAAVREFFSEQVKKDLEEASGTRLFVTTSGRGQLNHFKPRIGDELARLEKQWKLI